MTPGEEQAFAAFVRERGPALLRFSRCLVLDDGEAEDLLQVALLRVSRHWRKGLASPEAYARAALSNLAKDRHRRRHLVPVLLARPDSCGAAASSRLEPAQPDHAETLTEAAAARARLDRVLGVLPARQRVTVVLRVIEGLSEAETADVLGCSSGTVKSNLARGLGKVRAALDAVGCAQTHLLTEDVRP